MEGCVEPQHSKGLLVGIGGTTGISSRSGRANATRQHIAWVEGHVVPPEQSTEPARLGEACQTLPVSGTSEIGRPDIVGQVFNLPVMFCFAEVEFHLMPGRAG